MKVLALVILIIGSSAGLGSGPYLPSGWKPSGPAFYLPTEIKKPAAIPLKDVQLQETAGSSLLREYGPAMIQIEETETAQFQVESDASSSDALREYGPPKDVSQDLTQQALPDPVTEQAFVVFETKSVDQNEANAEVIQEFVITELITSVAETDTATESQNAEEQTQSEPLVEGKTEVESQTESSLASQEQTTETLTYVTEAVKIANLVEITQEKVAQVDAAKEAEEYQVEVTQQETNGNIVAAVEQKAEEGADVTAVESGVKNIAQALDNLENEKKAQQVQINEEVTEVKTIIQGSAENTPEGFLEYGPPGFTEYGPPKEDLKAVTEEKLSSTNEINETRRRRYSPKFRTPKRKNES